MMDTRYDHAQHEDRMYAAWEASNAFSPKSFEKNVLHEVPGDSTSTDARHFSIIMPPPNANDPLHIGHAMFVALEDVLTRFHRMRGDSTLWLPGTDHAGIETQFVFEKKLKKDGKSRFHFDRDTLYAMIAQYVQDNSGIAVHQLKKLGASADWSQFTFTLDPDIVQVVLATFLRMYQDKLIYRDVRLVNYCTRCGTGFSDLEVQHAERNDPLYYMRYGPFTIATVRPETKFRDTALAVNPNDPRYAQHLGKTFEIMGLLGPITMKIIGDEGVDPAFGTGIMKVTPAHDAHDFELGQRYNLPVTPIIDFTGKMDFRWYIDEPTNRPAGTPEQQTKWLERAQKYHGKKVAEARALMVEDLAADGLLLKTDTAYSHNVGTCYRCGNVLEPLPLPQFYIKTKPLTEPIVQALDAGEFVVAGAGHDKILRHWLTNLRDWNISRQIVWGIRLPVWYSVQEYPDMVATFREHTGESNEAATPRTDTVGALLAAGVTLETIAQGLQSLRAPANAHYIISPTSPGPEYLQETDTFDTWFSSSQWPFATLFVQAARAQTSSSKPTPLPYSPEEIAAQLRQSFSTHYPTTLMETGYDILPFWVMRMLMLGKYMTGKLPFTQVYLHGLVRDEKGAKMSKSKGNVINPLAVIDEFGADALRLALVIRSSAGLDKSVGVADFKAARNFTNKLWNAARFVLEKKTAPAGQAAPADANITARAQALVDEVTQQLQDLKIGLAADTLYNTFWHWFCDECIEQVKTGEVSVGAARTTLETFLKLLHPFVPFVTEAIWSELSSGGADSANNTSASTTPMPSASSLLISTEWPSTLHS